MNHNSIKKFKELATYIEDNKVVFLEALCHISTYSAANYEIDHVLHTLRNADKELDTIKSNSIKQLATYLPSNVILFSYILYGVVPTAYSKKVYIRPSLRGHEVAWTIHRLINKFIEFPIFLSMYKSRKQFWESTTSKSDVVAFTGKCTNSFEVSEMISDKQLFIYFGSGVNPIVVEKDADLSKAVNDIKKARIFNSGQDCLCPDLILVHKNIANKFIELLKNGLGRLIHGKLNSHAANYTNLIYPNVAEFCHDYFKKNHDYIIYGGKTDVLEHFVQPTILYRDIAQLNSYSDYPEFFAPVYNVATYDNYDQVIKLLSSNEYHDHAMGFTLYGKKHLEECFTNTHMTTFNQILFDVNYGNSPFGGSGKCASYTKYNKTINPHPVLISKEILKNLITDGNE